MTANCAVTLCCTAAHATTAAFAASVLMVNCHNFYFLFAVMVVVSVLPILKPPLLWLVDVVAITAGWLLLFIFPCCHHRSQMVMLPRYCFLPLAVTAMRCCPHVFHYFAASVGAKLIVTLKCFCSLSSCCCAILMLSRHRCSLLMMLRLLPVDCFLIVFPWWCEPSHWCRPLLLAVSGVHHC